MTQPTTPTTHATSSHYQIKAMPNWVWRSTDISIAKAQLSVLACFEIIGAMLLYYWLIRWLGQGSQWSQAAVIFYLFATPLLLFRSDASVALGKKWLNYYSTDEKLHVFGLSLTALASTVLACILIFKLTTHYTHQLNAWPVFWRYFFIDAVAVVLAVMGAAAVAGAVAGVGAGVMMMGTVALTCAILGVVLGGLAAGFMGVFKAGFIGAVAAAVASSVVAVAVIGKAFEILNDFGLNKWLRIACLILLMSLFASVFLGVLLATLLMRTIASLCKIPSCLKQLRTNTWQQGFCVDMCHPPELMPQAGEVSNEFSASGMLTKLKSTKGIEGFSNYLLYAPLLLIIYCPAMLYRFGLKSALWLWWPIILLVPQAYESEQAKIDKNKMFEEPITWRRLIFLTAGGLLINFNFEWMSINISAFTGFDLRTVVTLNPKCIAYLSQFNLAAGLWSIVLFLAWAVASFAMYPAYHRRIQLHPEKALNTFDLCRQVATALFIIGTWCLLLQQPLIINFVKLWWL